MSIPVEIADLQAKTAEYGWAYLLTVRPDSTPHLVSVAPQWAGDTIVLSVSGGTAGRATAGTSITLCYPPLDPDGYSLIVDGTATPVEAADVPSSKHAIAFTPTSAVLHRPAEPGFVNSATGCADDCLPVD